MSNNVQSYNSCGTPTNSHEDTSDEMGDFMPIIKLNIKDSNIKDGFKESLPIEMGNL